MQAKSNTQATTVPPLGRYAVDPGASKITFKTRHLFGLGPVRGTFPVRSGTVDITEPLTESTIRAEIDAAGFHTGNPMRNSAVRGKGLLDVGRFPLIAFTATVVNGTTLVGTLTVRDVTRPITVAIEQTEISQRSFTARGTATVDRTEFGITGFRGLAASRLTLTVEVRCALT